MITKNATPEPSQNAAVVLPVKVTNLHSSSSTATSSTPKITSATTTEKKVRKVPSVLPSKKPATSTVAPSLLSSPPPLVARVPNPYPTPPESIDQLNKDARAALVNIFCQTGNGQLHPISGSGVIIDPRGVILTNAHVAQYVLLAESSDIGLTCTIRAGSPATPSWKAQVLYMPQVWVDAHYQDINANDPTGTGEHDYALLLITETADGNPRPQSAFPYLPLDTRANIGFAGDQVLVAAYPAEFIGGVQTWQNLYADTSPTSINQLLTFSTSSVDLVSLGGVVEAQSGSSGGAIANMWGRLIGLIVTSSPGITTGGRDLHALTLSYIDRDFAAQSGTSLSAFLSGDVATLLDTFNQTRGPVILKQYYDFLKSRQQ